MTFKVTKTYSHNLGLTTCFRQHKAKSHCRFLHGYALKVVLVFSCEMLDGSNWVIDFGSLRPVKIYLADNFDHITVVAKDDPMIDEFHKLNDLGLCKLRVAPSTGCEAFAHEIFTWIKNWIPLHHLDRGVKLESVEVSEHGGNSATYTGDDHSGRGFSFDGKISKA